MNVNLKTITILTLLFCFGCTQAQEGSETDTSNEVSVEIPVYDFNELKPLLYTDSDKTYIVNFWAMWCAPCVKELPYLQKYADSHSEVEMLFVSLDFPQDIETKLKPFLKKKGITSPVVLLDDPDANSWIDQIDPNWSGALPLTIVFDKNHRSYHGKAFESNVDLENQVTKFNNTK